MAKGNFEFQNKLSIGDTMAENLKKNIGNLRKESLREKFSDFENVEHRLEFVANVHGIEYINDSKATTFASTINILKLLKEVFWLVGGIGKLGDKFTLKKNECKNIKAYVFGKNKNFFIKQFKNKLSYCCFNDLKF